jgi:hypothetical protein
MAFLFYENLLFTENGNSADGYRQVSSDNGYRSTFYPGTKPIYGSWYGVPQGATPIVDTSNWNSNNTVTINAQAIKDRVAHAYDNGYDIAWDLEALGELAQPGNPGVTDTQIDYILDTFEQIYGIGKAHRPQVIVGFYMHPTIRSYYIPVLHDLYPNDPSYTSSYNSWITNMQRKNKRWTGSEYVTKNFSDYCDAFFPDTYVFFENDTNMETYIVENVARTVDIFANGKPVYPYVWMHFHNSDKFINRALSRDEMSRYIQYEKDGGASGITLWGGWRASVLSYDYIVSTSKNVGQWASVDKGCFQIRLANIPVLVRGINFSASHPSGAVTTMSQVASRIETAINAAITSGFEPPKIEYPPGAYSVVGDPNGHYGLRVGPVTVTHNGSNFVFNSAGGVSSLSYGIVRPPDADRQQVDLKDYLYGLPDPSGNGWFVPSGGTDLVPGGYLSAPSSYSETAIDSNEWENGWGYGSPWHVAYKSAVDNEAAVPQNIDFSIVGGNVRINW